MNYFLSTQESKKNKPKILVKLNLNKDVTSSTTGGGLSSTY